MNWTDEGFVLSVRKHGESSIIVSLLTREHGRHAGLVRGGAGSRARGIYQPGNLVSADWRARLSEHLGTCVCELLKPYAAHLLTERMPLLALSSAITLLDRMLPEREPHAGSFESFARFIDELVAGNGWLTGYVRWELALLAELGYGLDLSQCAATGSTADLIYVSPRTGCAVSADAGAPYRDRLLALPAFLRDDGAPADAAAALEGLTLTGHFLARCAREAELGDVPDSRGQFIDRLKRDATIFCKS